MAINLRPVRRLQSDRIRRSAVMSVVILLVASVQGQTSNTGAAKATGNCNIVNTGNNDHIDFKNCEGVPESVKAQLRELIKQAHEDRHEIKALVDKFNEIQPIIESLGDKASQAKLLARYPLGYVIFDVDHSNEVFPYDRQRLDEYVINWDQVGILENTSTKIKIRLPGIRRKDGTGAIAEYGTLETPRAISGFEGGISIDVGTDHQTLVEWCRILAIKDTGIVFVVGFQLIPAFQIKPATQN